MKNNRTGHFIKGIAGAALVVAVTFTCAPARAAREMIYAVDFSDRIVGFYSDEPETIQSARSITGLQFGESIQGIDHWNGTIYGLGSSSRLYTVDPTTGAATQVGSGQFSPILNGQTFGADSGPSGFQVVSGLGGGQSLSVNQGTGVATAGPSLSYVPGDISFGLSPRVDALAYDDATGIWYAADTLKNALVTFNPITGGLSTIGNVYPNMGFDAAKSNGLDISSATGIMYLISAASSSDVQGNLYTVNMMTGLASLVGQVGDPGDNMLYRALTVVPEPSSIALLALGAFGLLFARRRQ